jgi:hypothetical protein
MKLYNDASVTKGNQKLTANFIQIDFETSELYATAGFDSTGKRYYGVPVFRDAEQELSANELTYNFRTRKGTLGAAETRLGEGFYYSERIHQVAPNIFFAEDGRYTTCDAPHPHYFFASPRMKVVVGDRVFADQVALNVADVPIFYIPFGVFFPGNTGRQSGLIIPRWSQSAQRGFTIEDLGFFWIVNDYLDTRIGVDIYSKGGYTIRDYSRFRLLGVIEQSDLDLTFGRTRNDPDDELETSYIVRYGHQMPIGRRSRLGGNLHFASQNAIRRTSTNTEGFDRLDDITTQRISSNFDYSTSWDWGGSLSASYSRNQNIITDELDQTIPISFSLPAYTPFADPTGEGGILSNLTLGYSSVARAQWVRLDTIPGGGFRVRDSRYGITHQPTISLTPKLGYFTFQPSFNYTESWFRRRIVKETAGDTIASRFIPGFYRAYSWSAGASVSTRLYGIIQPQVFGINAIRHTLMPTVSFRYSPDFGDRSYGFYDEFFNPLSNNVERYSIFETDAAVATIPGTGLQQTVFLDLRNDFEAKIAQGDTLPDKKLKLLSLGMNTSYNAAAPSGFRWNTIIASASTELGPLGYLSGNATFDLYDRDSIGRRIPELLIKNGKGLWQVQNAGVSFGTSFSDEGFNTGLSAASVPDSAAARRERFNFEEIPFSQEEFFGERVQGSSEFRLPWQVSLSGSYNISRIDSNNFQTSFNIQTTFSFSLTPTTRISSSGSYNFELGKFLIPQISLLKDLHCWEMQFDWRPSGYGRGFYFRIGLKSPQLRDVKLEQSETFYGE